MTTFDQIRTIEQMQVLEPATLERFVSWLYQRDGYAMRGTAVTSGVGVDLLVANGERLIVVQCKHGRNPISQPAVRELYAAMLATQAQEGHLVSTAPISAEAQQWAADKPITLVDGASLVAWVGRVPAPAYAPPVAAVPSAEPKSRSCLWIALLLLLGLFLCVGSGAAVYWYFDLETLLFGEPITPLAVPTPLTTPVTSTPDSSLPQPVATVTPRGGAGADGSLTAAQLDTPPTLDGDLEEWGEVPSFAASHRVYAVGGWNGTADLTAVWRLGWDAEYLYVAVAVQDDTHVQTETGNRGFRGDSLELQLSTEASRARTTLSPSEFQVMLSPGNFGSIPPEAFRFQANASGQMRDALGHRIEVAAVRQPDGYTLEAAILWSDLGMTSPSAGRVLGANLNANDNDTPNTAVQEVMMSTNPNRTFSNPSTWGVLTLE